MLHCGWQEHWLTLSFLSRFTSDIFIEYQHPGHLALQCKEGLYLTDILPFLDAITLAKESSSLESFTLRYCPVPDEPLQIYLQSLAVADVKKMYLYRANFSLTDNNIIEQHFEGINNLTLLKIEKSEVREIEVGAFESLIKLEELYLIDNKISNISPKETKHHVEEGTPSLHHFTVSHTWNWIL